MTRSSLKRSRLTAQMRMQAGVWVVVLTLVLAGCAPKRGGAAAARGPHNGVARSECFPVSALPPELRAKSEELLLRALDNEALYTLAGGLKPMSTVGATFTFAVDDAGPGAAAIAERRRLLSVWRCGDGIYADARVFRAINDGKRSVSSEVFYRPALDAVLSRHAAFFAPLGLTPGSHPMEVLTTIEWSERGPRWRGQGHLYGYPDYAVDFFVASGESEARTGQFVPRDPVRVPTFGATPERSNFVWTVARGHQPNDADRALFARAAQILAAYTERRVRYIGAGKPGAFALLRDWYCGDGAGPCYVPLVFR
jgi:hypothetical protein